MDFVRYAERAADLVNADPADAAALATLLVGRPELAAEIGERDVPRLHRFVRELREVFVTADAGSAETAVGELNALLARYPVTPCLSEDGAGGWHLSVTERMSSVSELLTAEALMGLATLVCELGASRIGVCAGTGCEQVFVDTSPNRSRRYCSDRCSSRANVAAYRARQRAAMLGRHA